MMILSFGSWVAVVCAGPRWFGRGKLCVACPREGTWSGISRVCSLFFSCARFLQPILSVVLPFYSSAFSQGTAKICRGFEESMLGRGRGHIDGCKCQHAEKLKMEVTECLLLLFCSASPGW